MTKINISYKEDDFSFSWTVDNTSFSINEGYMGLLLLALTNPEYRNKGLWDTFCVTSSEGSVTLETSVRGVRSAIFKISEASAKKLASGIYAKYSSVIDHYAFERGVNA